MGRQGENDRAGYGCDARRLLLGFGPRGFWVLIGGGSLVSVVFTTSPVGSVVAGFSSRTRAFMVSCGLIGHLVALAARRLEDGKEKRGVHGGCTL